MVPVSGTVRLKKPFVVKTDITHDSKTLTNLGVGTIVDLKGTKSNWMLIDWPSGPAEMSPGWIELPRKEDTRVETVNANAARVEKDKQAEKIKKKEEEKAKKDPDKAKKGRPKIILKIEDTGTKTKK
jgi:hypothetical protein